MWREAFGEGGREGLGIPEAEPAQDEEMKEFPHQINEEFSSLSKWSFFTN